MEIINATKNTSLAKDVIVADKIFARMKGLLGRKYFAPGEAMILKPCDSIHTFFMQFPIDVLFIDKNNRVIKVISNLKPFRVTSLYFNAVFAIELPAGIIASSQTTRGDVIIIK